MNHKQFVLTLLVAIISGLLGGALSVWFLMPPSVLAQDEPPKVITSQEFEIVHAREFRVVDGDGNIEAVLREFNGQPDLRLFDDNGKTRAKLSLERSLIGEEIPTLSLYQSDSEVNFRATPYTLDLGDYEYGISLRANREEKLGQVGLLVFRPEGSLSLGVSELDGSQLYLFSGDDQGFNVKLTAATAGTNITIADPNGNERAILGTIRLTHPDTGSTEIRAPSSLVLFDEEGKVVWSAP